MQGRDALGSTETVAPVRCRGGIRALGRTEAVAPVRDRISAGKGRPGKERASGPCEGQG